MQFWSIFTNIMEASLEESLYRNVSSISEIWEGLLPPIFLSVFRVLSNIWWSLFAKIVHGYHCVKSVRIRSYSVFWSVFFHIWTEYGEIRSISSYSVRIRENADQNNSEYGHFSRVYALFPWKFTQVCKIYVQRYMKY